VDGGIEVTASHNPMNYNGMKLVRENAKPISGDTGLRDIQRLAEENQFRLTSSRNPASDIGSAGVRDHLMGYVTGELHPPAEAGGELRQRRCGSCD
jgi:phosphomannomutase